MNIWILNHYATPPDTPGITRHYDFGRVLVKNGHKVTVFASGFSHRTRKEERLQGKQSYRKEEIDGVVFLWIRTPPYHGGNDWRRVMNMLSYTLRVIPMGLKLKEKPDAVVASSPHLLAGVAGWLLAKQKDAPFIFEVRDLWPQTFVDIGGYSNKSLVVMFLRVLEKFLYHRADKIVALLPKASDYITGLGVLADKIAYIPNGVSAELFADTGIALPEDLNQVIFREKIESKILVGYTGAHGIANALDTIIEAAKRLQDKGIDKIHFLLVGEGPDKARLVLYANSLSLRNVTFSNPIPKSSIPALLKHLDITLINLKLSKLYSYGVSLNKIFDYMISSKPIIIGINSENNPVAEAGCGIIVPPENPAAMAEAIVSLYEAGEQVRHVMGIKGYEYAMKYHSVPLLAGQLLEIINKLQHT